MPVYGGTPQSQSGTSINAPKRIDGVKHVVAVGAGKGGVGKSTIATNLALALSLAGKKVGLLDADIYGPSQPRMMGLSDARPNLTQQNKIDPVVKYGIKNMSLGFLVEDGSAIIWRGPMLFKAITQFLFDVNWGELDYLIVDLPPGTGDVQLTIAQKIPLDGAVIVSTPQDLALIDVKRCVDMFKRLKTPIVGLVENMSTLVCEKCGHPNSLFHPGTLHKYCEENQIPILASVPFNPAIGLGAEEGKPLLAEEKAEIRNGPDFQAFETMAAHITKLETQNQKEKVNL